MRWEESWRGHQGASCRGPPQGLHPHRLCLVVSSSPAFFYWHGGSRTYTTSKRFGSEGAACCLMAMTPASRTFLPLSLTGWLSSCLGWFPLVLQGRRFCPLEGSSKGVRFSSLSTLLSPSWLSGTLHLCCKGNTGTSDVQLPLPRGQDSRLGSASPLKIITKHAFCHLLSRNERFPGEP